MIGFNVSGKGTMILVAVVVPMGKTLARRYLQVLLRRVAVRLRLIGEEGWLLACNSWKGHYSLCPATGTTRTNTAHYTSHQSVIVTTLYVTVYRDSHCSGNPCRVTRDSKSLYLYRPLSTRLTLVSVPNHLLPLLSTGAFPIERSQGAVSLIVSPHYGGKTARSGASKTSERWT